MRITPDILYGLISERYRLIRYGKGIKSHELSLPQAYERGAQPTAGSIWIARTGDLPNRPPEGCVIICCGTKPPKAWNIWPCDIMYVNEPHVDVLDALNVTLGILDKVLRWEIHLQQLAASGADAAEMIEASIPIFENTMTVSDYELRILAHCEPDDSLPNRPVTMGSKYERVPTPYVSATKNFGEGLMHIREPYFIEETANPEEGIPGVRSYCINLFHGNVYVGTCALKEETHLLRDHELELFQIFAEYVRDCLDVQSLSLGNQFVTVRTLFEQILKGYPVSMYDMTQALKLVESGLRKGTIDECKWCCTVIENSRRGKELPEAYLSKTIEDILPNTTAFVFEGHIVALSLIAGHEHRLGEICAPLEAYLEDMDFVAGISRTFRDPFHARTHYRQALNALEMSYEYPSERRWHLFGDHVLDYMLANCCGDFDAESIVAPELVRLYASGASGPDYVDTLRTFLDNDCHTTKTAEVMYLHRSTLIKRLDRIREIVNLDSPDRRLYLRLCLHLPDIEEVLQKGVDAGGLD